MKKETKSPLLNKELEKQELSNVNGGVYARFKRPNIFKLNKSIRNIQWDRGYLTCGDYNI